MRSQEGSDTALLRDRADAEHLARKQAAATCNPARMANDLNDRPEAAHPDISRKGAPELGLPIRSETERRPTQACRAVSRTRGAYCQARIRKQDAPRIGEIPLVPVPATWISAASNSSTPNWSLSRRLDCCGWRRSDTPTTRRWAICSICRFPLSFAAPSLPARPGCQTPRWVGRNDLRCPRHLCVAAGCAAIQSMAAFTTLAVALRSSCPGRR